MLKAKTLSTIELMPANGGRNHGIMLKVKGDFIFISFSND
jgi:hypothetical protein